GFLARRIDGLKRSYGGAQGGCEPGLSDDQPLRPGVGDASSRATAFSAISWRQPPEPKHPEPMTDTTAENGAPQTPQPPAGPHFRVLTQFVRDFSFENPKAPESLRFEGKPQIDMGVEMNAQGRADGLFEVDLKLSIKATSGEAP